MNSGQLQFAPGKSEPMHFTRAPPKAGPKKVREATAGLDKSSRRSMGLSLVRARKVYTKVICSSMPHGAAAYHTTKLQPGG